MPSSQTGVATSSARRYLTQLCRHFAHRLPVSLAESHGRISFETGICTLAAEPSALDIRVLAADATELDRLRGMVARHLERFAFRETLVMQWETGRAAQTDEAELRHAATAPSHAGASTQHEDAGCD